MYNDYFGFRERPFSVTPDPQMFYATPAYQIIYNNLVYSLCDGKSLTIMTGDVGTGKTTILRRIMKDLSSSFRFAYFTYTTLPFDELLLSLCQDLEVPGKHEGQLQMLQALQTFLIARHNEGQATVLLIDEAQNLQASVLEDIRHLLNFTTASKALLPVVLVGQPELEKKLNQPAVYQLKQRVALHCQLGRLKERDVGPFIVHRLHAVGYVGKDLFTPEAVERIALYAQGVPRLVNILCDNVLLLAYSISERVISAEMIEEVAQDLGLQKTSAIQRESRPVFAPEQAASTQVALSPPQQEEKQPQVRVPFTDTSSTTPKNNVLLQIPTPKFGTTKSTPAKRLSLRQLVLAGTGLAFALWSFTLLPYGEGKDLLVPWLSSIRHITNTAEAPGKTTTVANLNELGTTLTRSSSDTSHVPANDSASTKQSPKEQPAPTTEEKTSPVTTKSADGSVSTTNAEGGGILTEVSEKKTPQSQEQKPLASTSDSSSAHQLLLLEVASQGDIDRGETLLREGGVPDVVDERGWTPLMLATLHGHLPMVQLLLKKGADVNLHNSTGGTALMMAALQGQTEVLQLLLDRGANVNAQDAKGWTALMYAARNGHTPTVQILLSSGAEVDLKNTDGRTALMYADARGHKDTARTLRDGKAGGGIFN